MQLRSTTRVAPQTTQYESSSPIHQNDDAIVEAVYEGEGGVTPNTTRTPAAKRWAECCKGVSGGTSPSCPDVNCDRAKDGDYDPCASKAPCPSGEQKQVSADGKSCNCVGTGESGEVSSSESLEVNEDGTSMRPLTNREVRMNQRMVDRSSARMQNDLNNANRRIRKAIRKGMPPLQSDLKMVSGESMGGLDPNFNPYLHTSGSKSIYTGVHRGAQNFESGGVNMNFNDEVQAAADKSMLAKGFEKNSDGKYFDPNDPNKVIEQSFLDGVMKDAKASVNTAREERGSYTVKDGQYLNNKTKRKLRKSGYKEGDKFGQGTLGSLEDTSGRTRKLQQKAKNASARKKERINRRIKRRGGTPVKMSIELTRPSYKQKGFGK